MCVCKCRMTVNRSWIFPRISHSLQYWSICVRVGPSCWRTDPAASISVVLHSDGMLCNWRCGRLKRVPLQKRRLTSDWCAWRSRERISAGNASANVCRTRCFVTTLRMLRREAPSTCRPWPEAGPATSGSWSLLQAPRQCHRAACGAPISWLQPAGLIPLSDTSEHVQK